MRSGGDRKKSLEYLTLTKRLTADIKRAAIFYARAAVALPPYPPFTFIVGYELCINIDPYYIRRLRAKLAVRCLEVRDRLTYRKERTNLVCT